MATKTGYSAAEVTVQCVAEREIMRYADNPYLWCRHCLGVTLNPHQLAWWAEMDSNQNNLLIGSRRIRKSFFGSMYFAHASATKPYAEINIHSPTLEQSKRNLRYMTERIVDSEILMAYIERRLGEGLGAEAIRWVNKSKVQAKGQASSTDGLGATHQWLEEFDDLNWDTFLERIFPTGSQLKPGFDYDGIDGCRRLVTGTIKGQGNLYRLEHPDRDVPIRFHVMTKLDAWVGVAAGLIPEADIIMARDQLMTPAQFARAYLCLYAVGTDYFSSSLINSSIYPGAMVAEPEAGRRFAMAKGRTITFGLDFEGQGDGDAPSRTAIVFVEQFAPGVYRWLYGRDWPTGTPPNQIRAEVVELCRYFRPAGGYCDAYDATLAYDINDDLRKAKLTRIDVTKLENKPGANGWDKFFLRPIRFHGPAKHRMFKRLQQKMMQRAFLIPHGFDDYPPHEHLLRFVSQLENVKSSTTSQGYDSFKMHRKQLGDDLVDATVAALWAQSDKAKKTKRAGGGARNRGVRGRSRQKFAARRFKSAG